MSKFSFRDEIEDESVNVYLAGPLSDYDKHEETHDRIKSECYMSQLNFVDPLNLEPEFTSGWEMIRKDLGAVELCDAVYVYWPGNVESWGTMAEIHHALTEDTPVVIWDMNSDKHNHWKRLPFTVVDELHESYEAVLASVRLNR